MIKGIGTDIVSVSRCRRLQERYQERFVNRILSEKEKSFFKERKEDAHFLAKRFAGKEAIAKAFGVGIGKELGFTDMHILPDNKGKPYVCFEKKVAHWLKTLGIDDVLISLSDELEYAVAFAIAFSKR